MLVGLCVSMNLLIIFLLNFYMDDKMGKNGFPSVRQQSYSVSRECWSSYFQNIYLPPSMYDILLYQFNISLFLKKVKFLISFTYNLVLNFGCNCLLTLKNYDLFSHVCSSLSVLDISFLKLSPIFKLQNWQDIPYVLNYL